MASAVIGALRVVFGADTAAFERGVTRAERTANRFEKQMGNVGQKLSSFGKSLTTSLTLPIAGVATAFGVAANQIAKDSREIATSANVAGESFENFQRQAFAAKTVGIEFEKLGDIFKDVRDRVGDFAATGGGPMADFFENIAPKVGVTADAFKGLSGKDSLQLYFDSLRKANVSQEEMVFYLEAMASDATNLIPLLENSGKAFDELGGKANIISDEDQARFEQYIQAQEKLGQATEKLVIAVVKSGLLDTIVELVEKFANWTSNLAETNPTLLKVGTIAAGVVAALGPFVSILGNVISLLGKAPFVMRAVGIAFRAMLGPIGLVLLAVEGLYLVWKNWDQIEPILRDLYNAAKRWLQERLGKVFDWVRDKLRAVNDAFAWLYNEVVGNSHVPDMVDGIQREFARLQSVMVDPAEKAAQSVDEAMRNMAFEVEALLARLFPEIARARKQMEELALLDKAGLDPEVRAEARVRLLGGRDEKEVSFTTGPLDAAARVGDAGKKMIEELEDQAKAADVQTVRIQESFKDMAEGVIGSLQNLTNSIRSGNFLDILGSVLGLFTQLGSTGIFGQTIANNINGPIAGARADGGPVGGGRTYLVGERGPELFTPSGHGRIIANDNIGNMGGAMNISVEASPYFDVRVNGRIVESAPAIANAGAMQAQAMGARSARRTVRR